MNDRKDFAAVFFLQNEQGKILAVSRKDNSNDFGLPGGKVDPGETSLQAAIRELAEETGLHVTPEHVSYLYERNNHMNNKSVVCFTTDVVNLSGQISLTETGIVEWVEPSVLVSGSFGPYNKALFDKLGIKYE